MRITTVTLLMLCCACSPVDSSDVAGDHDESIPPDRVLAHSVPDLPAPGTASSPIEGYADYDASIDTTTAKDLIGIMRPGTAAFADYLGQFGIGATTYPSNQTGFHPRGRALDIWISGDAGKQAFTDWLTANDSEMARRLGLNQIIYKKAMWRSYYGGAGKPQGAFGDYFGEPHLDHVHISFGELGADGATSFFTDVMGGGGGVDPTPTISTFTECGWLHVDEMIGTDRPLSSCDGQFLLAQQTDGNLVLYRAAGGAALWSSDTYGTIGNQTIMQSDGNLVLYTPNASPLFATGTNGFPGTELAVQTDGNLVLYYGGTAIWASGTAQ